MRALLCVLLFCCINTYAQKLNVDKFELKSNDITARTHPRQDINGNDCALVKVQLAAPNAVFEGNVIGDVAYETSEYMVYMAMGSKRMTIKLEGYLPLEVNFSDYGKNALEQKTVYLLTISGVVASKPVEPVRTKTGWIIINSEPSGATVYINDEFVGNTPLTNYKQAYGTYSYRIEHPNYHPSSGTIELNSGKTENTVKLKPAFGAITITSSVAGATVLLDGKPTNKVTPCTLEEIPSGQHTIIVQKDKYSPRQQSVNVEDGQTAKVSVSLDARFAQVSVASLAGAQIYCNGELKGSSKITETLIEGFYDIEARLAHHKTATKQIQVVAGQAQEITLNPAPIYGSLDVTSTPYDADVTIDGKLYGKTPLTVDQLLEGVHTVKLNKHGYSEESLTVTIVDNENITSFVQLKRSIESLPPVFGANNGNGDVLTQSTAFSGNQTNESGTLPQSMNVQMSKEEVAKLARKGWTEYQRREYDAAIKDLKKAVEQGEENPQLLTMIGCMYFKGEGVPVNYSEALIWFKRAAQQGYKNAQHNLEILRRMGYK